MHVLFASGCSDACPAGGANARADGRTLASAGDCADNGASYRAASNLPGGVSAAPLPGCAAAHDGVRREFRFLVDSFAKQATGSSNRLMRAMLLDTPPSLDAGEATD